MRGGHSITGAYRALLSATIHQAMDDLRGDDPQCPMAEIDRAMEFILGGDCEAYCLELEIDYETVKEKAAALYRRFWERDFPGRMPRL